MLGIASLSCRFSFLLGEANAENTEKITIRGLDLNTGFNQGLPFLDHGAEFVSSHIHTMEVGQQVAALQQLKQTLLEDMDKSKSEGLIIIMHQTFLPEHLQR